jgi:hypothetical protein
MNSEYCFECMNRQVPTPQQGYMPSMMPGTYESAGTMPFGMQQGPIPMDFNMQQMPLMQQQMPGMPTMQLMPGMQATQQFQGLQPTAGMEGGPAFQLEQGTPVETNINYTQAYLRTKIGSRVKIEFLIGTNMLIDREGTLTDVGISYVIIREVETDDLLLCDIYSIKFVRFYY